MRFVFPGVEDVCIGGESLQGFRAFCDIVSIQEVVQVFSELLVIVIISNG